MIRNKMRNIRYNLLDSYYSIIVIIVSSLSKLFQSKKIDNLT